MCVCYVHPCVPFFTKLCWGRLTAFKEVSLSWCAASLTDCEPCYEAKPKTTYRKCRAGETAGPTANFTAPDETRNISLARTLSPARHRPSASPVPSRPRPTAKKTRARGGSCGGGGVPSGAVRTPQPAQYTRSSGSACTCCFLAAPQRRSVFRALHVAAHQPPCFPSSFGSTEVSPPVHTRRGGYRWFSPNVSR